MKIKFYIAAILATMTLASCNDILNQLPKSEESETGFDTDAASVNNRVIGCYNALQTVQYWEWSVTELRTDNARMYANNSSANTSKLIEQLDQGTIATSHQFMSDYWDAAYMAISRCNRVLENLHLVEDPTLKAQYEAEAKFIRAHIYFNLVRLWGPVFIVTKSITAPEARYQERSSVADVYTLIEGDLEAIVTNKMLPVKHSNVDLGRANLLAAQALLAKVYMTNYAVGQGKYSAAKDLLLDVITQSGNPQSGASLVPFADIYDIQKEGNSEIIFAIRYLSGGKGLGNPFGNLFAPSSSGSDVIVGDGSAYNYPSDNIISAYAAEPGDLRKNITLAESYFDQALNQEITKAPCRYVKKYLSPVTTRYDGESDCPVIRLGDVILLLAELENELSGPANAIKYLNMTRTRAGLTELTTTQLYNTYTCREAIRNERRLELAFENQRWFDLLRWGIAAQRVSKYLTVDETAFYSAYTQYVVKGISDWQTFLPIPLSVININPDIAQNVGY